MNKEKILRRVSELTLACPFHRSNGRTNKLKLVTHSSRTANDESAASSWLMAALRESIKLRIRSITVVCAHTINVASCEDFFHASPEGRTGVSSYTGEGRHLGGIIGIPWPGSNFFFAPPPRPEGRTGVSSYTGEGRHYFFCGAFKNRFLWTDAGVDDLTTSVLTCKICGLDKNLRFCSCTWWFVYYCADVEGPEENLRPERECLLSADEFLLVVNDFVTTCVARKLCAMA